MRALAVPLSLSPAATMWPIAVLLLRSFFVARLFFPQTYKHVLCQYFRNVFNEIADERTA